VIHRCDLKGVPCVKYCESKNEQHLCGVFKMRIIEDRVLQWADDRGILKNGRPETQMLKLVSEMGELADNLAKGKDIKDDIGDCLVVLTIIANMKKTNLAECYTVAYNDIKDRKGYLNENGVFIKELPLSYTFDIGASL
jgi:NTP pyrophosphatase (non-canonical NTP hydrolase)